MIFRRRTTEGMMRTRMKSRELQQSLELLHDALGDTADKVDAVARSLAEETDDDA